MIKFFSIWKLTQNFSRFNMTFSIMHIGLVSFIATINFDADYLVFHLSNEGRVLINKASSVLWLVPLSHLIHEAFNVEATYQNIHIFAISENLKNYTYTIKIFRTILVFIKSTKLFVINVTLH